MLLALALATVRSAAPVAWPVWALTGVTALSVVILFASGALLSGRRAPARAWARMHRIAPYCLVAAGVALILLTGGSID